jgi:hypothetical protein
MYTCDNWIVIFLNGRDPHYRLLTGTSGGYTTGDSWRMNSGITKVEEDEHYYYFHGSSGSCYSCHKDAYGLRMNNAYIWNQLQELHGDKVEMLDENTNWMEQDWIIS